MRAKTLRTMALYVLSRVFIIFWLHIKNWLEVVI
jgi:hypothetical protein